MSAEVLQQAFASTAIVLSNVSEEQNGGAFVLIAAIDTFTHGWDLAKATGQATDLDPVLAAQLLDVARASLPDSLRGPDGQAPFGPRVEVAVPLCPADELAAFMGRQP